MFLDGEATGGQFCRQPLKDIEQVHIIFAFYFINKVCVFIKIREIRDNFLGLASGNPISKSEQI